MIRPSRTSHRHDDRFRHRARRPGRLLSGMLAALLVGTGGVLALQHTAGAAEEIPAPANKATTALAAARVAEKLDRGLVAVPASGGNLVTWRMLGDDPESVTFRLYRGGTLIEETAKTNYLDAGGSSSSSYEIRAVVNGTETKGGTASVWANGRLDIPLQKPPGGTTRDGVAYTYAANDASVGDLDGDGQYELVLKWVPSNATDVANSGTCTGPTVYRRVRAQRHPAVAGQPRHERAQRLALRLVPGLRLQRRRQGRDGRPHLRRFERLRGHGHRRRERLPPRRQLRGDQRRGVPVRLQRADRARHGLRPLRARPRLRRRLGRHLGQPRGPAAVRHRLPQRLDAQHGVQPRHLRAHRAGRVHLERHGPHPHLEVRHQLLDEPRQGLRPAGQPQPRGRRRRRGRPGRDPLRRHGRRRQRQRPVDHQAGTRRRPARR